MMKSKQTIDDAGNGPVSSARAAVAPPFGGPQRPHDLWQSFGLGLCVECGGDERVVGVCQALCLMSFAGGARVRWG